MERLVVQKYPSKREFEGQAKRDDVVGHPFIHVDIIHDTLGTVELYGLLAHEWPPRNLPKKQGLALLSKLMEHDNYNCFHCLVAVSGLDLHERFNRKEDDRFPDSYWICPQIQLWWADESKEAYKMWINWCKRVLSRKATYAKAVGGSTYNPFEGLRMRVRVEFHD